VDFAQADKIFTQPFLAGLDHLGTLINGTPRDVTRQAKESIADAASHPFILAPGCTMKMGTKPENIEAIKQAVLD
jgi:uroporphyrinogen-III decarboxylase